MTPPLIKPCSRCGVDRPLSEFYKSRKGRDGRQARCIHCERLSYRDNRPRHSQVSRTINTNHATLAEKAQARRSLALLGPSERPETRAACFTSPRPCPFATCKWNLAIDVNPRNGTITLVYGSEDIEDWRRGNCALDHAQRGGMTLDEVAEALAITRERARQIEERANSRLRLRREIREVDRD